jgi:beta-lactam-binding protein with PASTA domain
MPDLIGRDAQQVLAILERAGLKVTDLRYRSYPGIAPGIVLRQSPAAGQRVNARAALALDVSRPAS